MKKLLSSIIFKPKRDEIGQESEKNILVPNSVHTQHGQENSETSSKKFEKTIKPLPGNIFCQNGMRYTEKEKTKFLPGIPFILDSGKKIPKK